MIDIRILRDDPERVRENCRRRGAHVDVDALHKKDQAYLILVREVEDMRAERNRLSKLCKDDISAREKVRELKKEVAAKEAQLSDLRTSIDQDLAWLPNFLADDVPSGEDDEDNVALRHWGQKPDFSFDPRSHDQLGEKLGIIDTERGAKVAQSGFYYWAGAGAQLASALFFWAQQELVKRGFQLFMTPCAAKERTLFGTGYLPFFEDQTYTIADEDLALIGTSEQTLVGYHADEIITDVDLPLRYAAYSPCFRTEAGSYGKESRGIFRVHQFHKVEQIVFCRPEDSPAMHESCQENEEYLLQQLGIPYRVVNVCIGDMGAPGYKKYDIEAWFPGYGGYREVTSNTNLTDFQARRLGIRYRSENGDKHFVHTISATAVTDRVACAIMENFQQEDGSILVPEVLRSLTGFDRMQLRDA
ncbi:MAG: serine--tRNA ligase [Candidatus Pacebacteria bacterium]|nr:serine--tRNA ligase [Candidatus Paceibacterota bacterium]